MRGTQPACETHHKKDWNMNLEDYKHKQPVNMGKHVQRYSAPDQHNGKVEPGRRQDSSNLLINSQDQSNIWPKLYM